MLLTSYYYREFWDADQHWEVNKFSLSGINLLVGRNSSGKSRVVNTMHQLALFIRNGSLKTWNSGHWRLSFSHDGTSYDIELMIQLGKVTYEEVRVSGETKLIRDLEGNGSIWFSEVDRNMSMSLDSEMLAMFGRRDRLQHQFLEPIHQWAASLRMYQFSTDLGRQTVTLHNPGANPDSPEAAIAAQAVLDQNAVVEQYQVGYARFGDPFDLAVLEDMEFLGYPCSVVESTPAIGAPIIGASFPLMLQVQEVGLKNPTSQLVMSTGMFRALAIIIHVNFAIMSQAEMTLIVDDIGEGLDFDRSKSIIKRLIEKCEGSRIQLVLTSNDRFVMNEIDLLYWHVLDRKGAFVSVKDHSNSSEVFEEFSLSGLSNFDFFAMEAYKGRFH